MCTGRTFFQAPPLCIKVQIPAYCSNICAKHLGHKNTNNRFGFEDEGRASSCRPSSRGPKVRSFPVFRINDRVSRVSHWCRIRFQVCGHVFYASHCDAIVVSSFPTPPPLNLCSYNRPRRPPRLPPLLSDYIRENLALHGFG